MCLGVPGLVLERSKSSDGLDIGTVEFGGVSRSVCLALVPDARVGDFVLVHAGVAIQVVDEALAAELLERIRELGDHQEVGADEIPR